MWAPRRGAGTGGVTGGCTSTRLLSSPPPRPPLSSSRLPCRSGCQALGGVERGCGGGERGKGGDLLLMGSFTVGSVGWERCRGVRWRRPHLQLIGWAKGGLWGELWRGGVLRAGGGGRGSDHGPFSRGEPPASTPPLQGREKQPTDNAPPSPPPPAGQQTDHLPLSSRCRYRPRCGDRPRRSGHPVVGRWRRRGGTAGSRRPREGGGGPSVRAPVPALLRVLSLRPLFNLAFLLPLF